ncbi:MAG: hypothetical protein HDT14_04715 [Oscillibacter sp.]|nr:hypothetical protein [Oscillibacter sp.]
MNFTELKNFIEDMTAEISNLKTAIEYTERFLMDESPLAPQHLAEMKADLAEMTEKLEGATKYAERLAAY